LQPVGPCNIIKSQGKSRSLPKALTHAGHQYTPTVKMRGPSRSTYGAGAAMVHLVVPDFLKGHVFDPADLVIHVDGLCWLNLKWPG
jgi:hypothetical protein